jgi:hypothetical protein
MPRKTNEQKAREQAEQALASRPFAVDSTDPYGSRDDAGKAAVAAEVAAAKASGASGNEMRERFGERLTGPARRKLLRAHGFDGTAYVARSYDAYRDGESRSGTRHAREHGAEAASKRAQALAEAEAEAEAARKARKGRSKAERAAYAARVAEAEARVASLA